MESSISILAVVIKRLLLGIYFRSLKERCFTAAIQHFSRERKNSTTKSTTATMVVRFDPKHWSMRTHWWCYNRNESLEYNLLSTNIFVYHFFDAQTYLRVQHSLTSP
jgi:hypothetical protein